MFSQRVTGRPSDSGLLDEPAFKWWEVWASGPNRGGGTVAGNQTGSNRPLREGPSAALAAPCVASHDPLRLFLFNRRPGAAHAHCGSGAAPRAARTC